MCLSEQNKTVKCHLVYNLLVPLKVTTFQQKNKSTQQKHNKSSNLFTVTKPVIKTLCIVLIAART
jgi:hypothetical protein